MDSALVQRSTFAGVVASEGARVAEVARSGPLDARVPHLKRWTLTDVVAHLGGVHRWAAGIVSTRAMSSAGYRKGSERGAALVAWFEDGLEQLVGSLEDADLDAPCPNFSPGSPSTAEFWARRQAHETTMHRWDAESATSAPTALEPRLASDGIDETFRTFTRTRGRQVLATPIVVACTDVEAAWRLYPATKPGRVDVARTTAGTDDAAAAVAGRSEDLLLALWHRRPFDEGRLSFDGDRVAAEAFLSGPVTA